MKIIHKKPNQELLEKINKMHPDFCVEVNDVYEYEVHWWEREWWSIHWYAFIVRLCEWMVPSLKGKDDEIKIE